MIKHIVMWTLKDGDREGVKHERLREMKSRLMSLKDQISEIVSLDVRFNSSIAPGGNYDIILQTEFQTWATLEAYQKHPLHMAVADFINDIRENRAAIDYEF